MWLWKKFWNTDIIGKIYILIILFIVVVATIAVITRYGNKKEIKQEQNTTNVEQLSYNDNVSIEETTPTDNTIKEDIVETETEKNIKNTIIEAKENTKQQTTINNVKAESVNISQPKTEQETSKSKQEFITENKVTEAKSMDAEIEEQLPTLVPTNNVEEYRTNQSMIETIKSVINNNPSEDMKTYGFEIVIDSSIPELTNEFTYSESRVKSKIAYKFGTIRIYARDYYCNGNYISTQCFII